jgi:CRISPR system Cascade subunit CasA
MFAFNLIDEKWIPCVMANGDARELNLRDVLTEAHEVHEIFTTSPLVTSSLHRLLLAILHRCFPTHSLAEWKTLWLRQYFDAAVLNSYFAKWYERFDLLHTAKPFYQRSNLALNRKTPLKRLGWEFAAGNNATLFDHSWDENRPAILPATAACWIVATQSFAASAGKSETIHTKDSPWSRGAAILMQGDNLFETLALNLLNLLKPDFPSSAEDIPVWEANDDWQPAHAQIPNGILEYLTWQSRSVRLLPDESGELRECFFAQGRAITEDFKNEPMYAYKRDNKQGLLVWQFNEGRVMWRDSHALFNLSDDAPFQIPQAFHHLARLVRDGVLERQQLYRLQVLGQCLESGQPTIRFWRHERLPLRVAYLNEKPLLEKLREAITLTEETAKALQQSICSLARALIEYVSERRAKTEDIQPLTDSLNTDSFYWSQLEAPFKQLLTDLPNDLTEDDEEEIEYGRKQMPAWAHTLHEVANEAFSIATRSLDGTSRSLKAVAVAERSFHVKLRGVLGSYLDEYRDAHTQTTGGN